MNAFEVQQFHLGELTNAYDFFGAQVVNRNNQKYTHFRVWAPHAKYVHLLCDANEWKSNVHRMMRMHHGIWEIEIGGNHQGMHYKYEITTHEESRMLKTDPFAFRCEVRPKNASIVCDINGYQWHDQDWMERRKAWNPFTSPIFIYEVHLGTWKKKSNGAFYSYRELAHEIIPYVKQLACTHIELLPIMEHPFDGSWGYQMTGYFAATSRFGLPVDFMYFVDQCHQNGIGVILDWVPGHFCKDNHGLSKFDGSHLFEYETEHHRENWVWGTANFDLGKNEVRSFLLSNAFFWLNKYHVDGFRVDAVSNILYWANEEHSVNEYGISFLQTLHTKVFSAFENILMIAEDSSTWDGVTRPVHLNGLGFSYKWNMGWMNDVLRYISLSSYEKKHHHHLMTFSMMYGYNENFILPISHDEVVHGKKSLLDKMPGTYEEKFAQLRMFLMWIITHPGKKLLFMGSELAPFSEWKDHDSLDWHLNEYEAHRQFHLFYQHVLHLYRSTPCLFQRDHDVNGFQWIDANNNEQSIFSYIRYGDNGDFCIVILNFREFTYPTYRIGVPKKVTYRETCTTSDGIWGGNGIKNNQMMLAEELPFHGYPYSIEFTLPAFSAIILEPIGET